MSDIGSPGSPPPIEPGNPRWWRERMSDLGFWGVIVIVFLVAVLLYGQVAGNSGATGEAVVVLCVVGVGALAALGVIAFVRARVSSGDRDDS